MPEFLVLKAWYAGIENANTKLDANTAEMQGILS